MSGRDATIAKPSAACCLKGNIHEGQAKGTTTTIAGVETYIAKPAEGAANGNVVLYFPDVFGLFNNALLIMDAFAEAGYLALGLDYFHGDAIWKHRKSKDDTTTDPDFDFEVWKNKHLPVSNEDVPRWVAEVKKQYGKDGAKFACVGYCWGAPFVSSQLAKDGVCAAGAFAHPAFLKESHFYNLTSPLFLSCSEIDSTFPNEFRNRAVDIMQEEKKRFQVQLFQGVEHGFALRCDLNDPWQKYTKEQSLIGIIGFFDFWLSQK
ncbi:Alpha/Beta hydrolase protein [Neohortaea acidophila]|uniref:Alpha/Beta hydrolase protein n=1 Tax=Neohortaea acidophila TaxID=245834 RepID=A0A6A6PPR5_9PEZI|nr:Alpha/Beta hydrolase protein [Neohortaea acidophila]KAF2481433.1 Alpha/Beta hydrolase protein [Neohortaea acidophila]